MGVVRFFSLKGHPNIWPRRCGHRIARDAIRTPHLTGLISSEQGVKEDDNDSDRLDRSFPRFLFRLAPELVCVAGMAMLGIPLSLCGFSVIENEVPRQLDSEATWFAFLMGALIFFVGQGCALFTAIFALENFFILHIATSH